MKLIILNLPRNFDKQSLALLFKKLGDIKSCDLVTEFAFDIAKGGIGRDKDVKSQRSWLDNCRRKIKKCHHGYICRSTCVTHGGVENCS